MKKVLLYILSICMLFTTITLSANAEIGRGVCENVSEVQNELVITTGELLLIQNGALVDAYVPGDMDEDIPVVYGTGWEAELRSRIVEMIEEVNTSGMVYIGDLEVNYEDSWDAVLQICQDTINSIPDCWWLTGEIICSYYYSGNIVSVELVNVNDFIGNDKMELAAQNAIFEARIQEILEDCIYDGMSDLEKALALHDYLVRECDYDYENYLSNAIPAEAYSAYGALVDGRAVCNGYALGYAALLQRVGISTKVLSSWEMNHAWNLVFLDGEWYHVDATWNDPVFSGGDYAMEGFVRHTYFLRSDSEMEELEHYGWELQISAYGEELPVADSENSYEGYCFRNYENAMNYVNNKWYYLTDYDVVTCSNIDGSDAVEYQLEQYMWYAHSLGADLYLAGADGIYVARNMDFDNLKPIFLCADKAEYKEYYVEEFAIKQGQLVFVLYGPDNQQVRLVMDPKTMEKADKIHTVNFHGKGGEASIVLLKVADNNMLKAPEIKKTGYILDGWYKDADYSEPWDFTKDVVTEDMTLYAKWKDDPAETYAINAINFPDEAFRKYVSESIDTNADGQLIWSERIQVKQIDVDDLGVTSLQGIQLFHELESLTCSNNKLAELDVSKNKNLMYLYCESNQLAELDLSNCTSLVYLRCDYNSLYALDVSDCAKLEWFYVSNNTWNYPDTQIDITGLEGFEADRIVEDSLYNGKLEGNILSPIDSRLPVGYNYDMGQSKTGYFQIQFKARVTEQFTDVLANEWYVSAIQYVYNNDIMKGKKTDTFEPNVCLARAEIATVLNSIAGKPQVSYYTVFKDVAKGQWYTNPILWAYENELAKGYPNGNYGIADDIQREQLALMLYNYSKMKGYDVSYQSGVLSKFADQSKVSSWALTAMEWAVSNGVISGKGNASEPQNYRLDPQGSTTRAECAAMIRSMMTKVAK